MDKEGRGVIGKGAFQHVPGCRSLAATWPRKKPIRVCPASSADSRPVARRTAPTACSFVGAPCPASLLSLSRAFRASCILSSRAFRAALPWNRADLGRIEQDLVSLLRMVQAEQEKDRHQAPGHKSGSQPHGQNLRPHGAGRLDIKATPRFS